MKRLMPTTAAFLVASAVSHSDPPWTNPVSPVQSHGRLALGNRLHIVGHTGSNLVHRSSTDNGATWSAPTTVAPAATNFPMMYGGLFVQGDTVYLLTAAGDMSPAEQPADFRRSSNNGQTWSAPIRITTTANNLRRARITASGRYVHVAGLGTSANGFVAYFRSTNGGATWEAGRRLADTLGTYGGGQTIGLEGNTLHIPYTKVRNGVGGGDTYYIRSTDNGQTWSSPVLVGEQSASSSRQARLQVVAADGRVFMIWQREADSTSLPIPPERLGYNRSNDGGATWLGPRIMPDDYGVNREHQHVWMAPGGRVHVGWWDGGNTAGYKSSPDYGATWDSSEIALTVSGQPVPYTLVADANWAHFLTGPQGNFQYARRPLTPTGIRLHPRARSHAILPLLFHGAPFTVDGRLWPVPGENPRVILPRGVK